MGRIWSNGSGLPLNAANLNSLEADLTHSVRFEDTNGNPIDVRRVVIKVNTSTWDVEDIVAEA